MFNYQRVHHIPLPRMLLLPTVDAKTSMENLRSSYSPCIPNIYSTYIQQQVTPHMFVWYRMSPLLLVNFLIFRGRHATFLVSVESLPKSPSFMVFFMASSRRSLHFSWWIPSEFPIFVPSWVSPHSAPQCRRSRQSAASPGREPDVVHSSVTPGIQGIQPVSLVTSMLCLCFMYMGWTF